MTKVHCNNPLHPRQSHGLRSTCWQPDLDEPECSCHRGYPGISHESCCGHDNGRDPNCPFHGDGSVA